MKRSWVRTLIVDDYERWRRFIRQTLSADEKFQIIGEAADGLDAVEKGRELLPDLIILDIGLPAINGNRSGAHLASGFA